MLTLEFGADIAYPSRMRVALNSMDYTSLSLMDNLWQKNDNSKNSQSNSLEDILLQNMPNLPKAAQLQPDWNRIPSKGEAMSEEDFEKAIRDLAFKSAGKGAFTGAKEYAELLTKYISVASPDRKAAYEKFNGTGDTIYGSSNEKLMIRGDDGVWKTETLTKEESERYAKFAEIYSNAIKEYEAEHGSSQATESAKVANNPYSQWTYNSSSSYMYNFLA